jgi:hypothetical protein
VRALIGIDPCPMAAIVIRAIDQQAANAGGAHFGDLGLADDVECHRLVCVAAEASTASRYGLSL